MCNNLVILCRLLHNEHSQSVHLCFEFCFVKKARTIKLRTVNSVWNSLVPHLRCNILYIIVLFHKNYLHFCFLHRTPFRFEQHHNDHRIEQTHEDNCTLTLVATLLMFWCDLNMGSLQTKTFCARSASADTTWRWTYLVPLPADWH